MKNCENSKHLSALPKGQTRLFGIPEGTVEIEILTTDEHGRTASSGTIRVKGHEGQVILHDD